PGPRVGDARRPRRRARGAARRHRAAARGPRLRVRARGGPDGDPAHVRPTRGGVTVPERAERFDAESVREAWDHAADAYAGGQAAGQDHYRYALFGPAQLALCGDVAGRRVLDVGCGSGYLARELAR